MILTEINLMIDVYISSNKTNHSFVFLNLSFTEFLLGEDILVAPVISKNAVSRDVYLPTGLWRDENRPNSPLISGRTWLKKYPANLKILPWFTNVGSNQIHTSSDTCNHFNIQSKYLLFIAIVLFVLWYIFYLCDNSSARIGINKRSVPTSLAPISKHGKFNI